MKVLMERRRDMDFRGWRCWACPRCGAWLHDVGSPEVPPECHACAMDVGPRDAP